MKVTAIIQARNSSQRLPGKVLKNLANKPMLLHIVERLEQSKVINNIVVSTSDQKSDDAIEKLCIKEKIKIYRGSLDNVLQRYIDTLNIYPANYFVRVTGDCPLISYKFIEMQIKALKVYDADFIDLNPESSLFVGQGVHSFRSLNYIASKTTNPIDLEHVGSKYILDNIEKFKIVKIDLPKKYINKNYRVTVDEEKDYRLISHLYRDLYQGKPINIDDAIIWFDNNFKLLQINSNVKESSVNFELKKQKINLKIKYCGKYSWKF